MPIYNRPTKELMREWAEAHLQPGQEFDKSNPLRWFRENYPKIKLNTVQMHVEGMSINNHSRKHHKSIKKGSGHDLFWKIGPNRFRLWNRESDPPPKYKPDFEGNDGVDQADENHAELAEQVSSKGSREFAYEKDLQNYLSNNLTLLEDGLTLYEDEGLSGVEFSVGGRFVDILGVGADSAYVVIELKVSRGYDKAVGQLLRYMNWVAENMCDTQQVRGIIVASDISEDLKLATKNLPNVKLIEYELSFKLRPIP